VQVQPEKDMLTRTIQELVTFNILLISSGIIFCNIFNMPYIGETLIVIPCAILCTGAVIFLWLKINEDPINTYNSTPDIENPYQVNSKESYCILINTHTQ
jgi:hypothetical protein